MYKKKKTIYKCKFLTNIIFLVYHFIITVHQTLYFLLLNFFFFNYYYFSRDPYYDYYFIFSEVEIACIVIVLIKTGVTVIGICSHFRIILQ